MKYTDVPRGQCVKFPYARIVFHPLYGNDIVIKDRALFFFKPYVVEGGLLASVNSTNEDFPKVGFSEERSMALMRFQYEVPFPRTPMFAFWGKRKFSLADNYEGLSDTSLCQLPIADMIDVSDLLDRYGTGDGTLGEYRIYLDKDDTTWYIKFYIDNSDNYSYGIVCSYIRDNIQVLPDNSFGVGTTNPLHYTDINPANDRYIYTFDINNFRLPVEFSEDGNTYGFLTLYDPSYQMGIIRYNKVLNPTGNAFMFNAQYALGYSQSTGGTTFSKNDVDRWFGDYEVEETDYDNPYDDLVDDENQGGEDTNFGENSDNVSEDDLPTYDAVGTGFATIFTPNKTQLKQLADVMWNSNVFTALQNLVENITNMFTALSIVPFNVERGNEVEVSWLGLPLTSIYLYLAAKQYYEFDMGSINLNDDNRIFKYDNCLDYSPFSKLGIYLPFIGFQELDIDECRNRVINLKYRIDILSGTCVAIIKLDGSTLYQFTGNCLTQIPITNASMQSLVTDAVNVGIAMANAKSAGAASAADIKAAEDSNISAAKKDAHKAHARVTQSNADAHLQSAAANAMMGLKPQYNKTGSVSAAASLLSVKQPYLFLHTPKLSIPSNYQHYAGFPCNMTGKLSNFSGFTVVESIRLNDLVATSQEVEEIYTLLKQGVII